MEVYSLVSEKLDRIIEAEAAAAKKIADAEKKAFEIIESAKAEAEMIRENKKNAAKKQSEELISAAAAECEKIRIEYEQSAESEAANIKRSAAKNEMFGISSVITKIIP